MGSSFQDVRHFDATAAELGAAVAQALSLTGWTVVEDPAGDDGGVVGRFDARVGISARSKGEDVAVQVEGGSVICESRSQVRTAILDLGKNRANVKRFFAQLATLGLTPVDAASVPPPSD